MMPFCKERHSFFRRQTMITNLFSDEEIKRYSRHLAISEFNIEGQKKLKASKVLVVGAGGLGSPVILYLAAAGVGKLGVADYDTVDISNLQRQVLFTSNDVGKPKSELVEKKVKELNPFVEIEIYNKNLSSDNALEIIKPYDIVVDGYLINDACMILDKPWVYGSVYKFEGQVAVFNWKRDGETTGPNYRDLFPEPPPPGLAPNCAEGGVIGVLPGIIGTMQANEVIKMLCGLGNTLSGKILLYDGLRFDSRIISISKRPDAPAIKQLIDYEEFCNNDPKDRKNIQELDVLEFIEWQKNNIDFELIDVRETEEHQLNNIGGKSIPVSKIDDDVDDLPRQKRIVLYCQTGERSAKIVQLLNEKYGFLHVYNLKGGINAYSEINL